MLNKAKFILFLWLPLQLLAQGEGQVWYFGQNAGLDFSGGSPIVRTDGQINSYEGCASVTTINGDLLFYTDGVKIWDADHQVMPNGLGLNGSQTTTQSALIIRKPGSGNIYYVFTTEGSRNGPGFRYSIVDMQLRNGKGDVTTRNKLILTNTSEKLTAIRHRNERDFWILTHQLDNDQFHAVLLDPFGLSASTVVSRVGSVNKVAAGYLKASVQGTKVACLNTDFSLELFDFDNKTGKLSNAMKLDNIGSEIANVPRAYGVEFSPSGNLIYVGQFGSVSKITQFSLLAISKAEIEQSAQVIYEHSEMVGAMLLGPDQKIYVSRFNSQYLGVINDPNTDGTGCNYVPNAVYLEGKKTSLGLPNFHNSYTTLPDLINFRFICLGETTEFTIQTSKQVDSVQFFIMDKNGIEHRMSMDTALFKYAISASYEVRANIYYQGLMKELSTTVTIITEPEVSLPTDTSICENDVLEFTVSLPYTQTTWQTNVVSERFLIRKEGLYTVQVSNICGDDSSSIQVEIKECICQLHVPNAFSPNSDGINDRYNIQASCELENYTLLIYDRWGKQVYQTSVLHQGWDGTYKEIVLPEDTYYYLVFFTPEGQSAQHVNGILYLIR